MSTSGLGWTAGAARPDPAAERTEVSVVVGRQPIVDRQGAVVAFELLYRSRDAADVSDATLTGDQMTAHVVLGALTIGVDQLVGDKTMFCNAERGFIVSESPVTLPPDRTVIEVLETVEIDDETVEGCRNLVAAGFRLALDDFVWTEHTPRLLELASIVKVDFQATSREHAADLVERCRPYDVLMLAEKVETEADVSWAMAHGFDLFQGFAIERPVVVQGRTVTTSLAAQMKLATALLTEDLDLDQIESILRREPGLVVQMLQLASAGGDRGLRRPVHSIREALVMLGTKRIRQWVALTILSGQSGTAPDGLAIALSRARMLELLASGRGLGSADFAFTAGLLSSLDVLLGVHLEQLGAALEIDDDLKAAAFDRTGDVGRLVAEVASYQEGLYVAERTTGRGAADLDIAAAAAFAWTMPYLSSIIA